ncbi:MAG: hypothetical protein IOD12_15555 [Silvanigrellales bacterium]|jgi:hypothetical protein|nr:hypothetical protein [Silvanigrellales bacterium]
MPTMPLRFAPALVSVSVVVLLGTMATTLGACGKAAEDAQEKVEDEFRPAPASKACGPEGSFSASFVPESWLGLCGDSRVNANFAAACVAHDTCYDSLGQKRETCDAGFRADLEKECETVYADDACTPSRRLCRDIAKEYYTQVSAKGADAFRRAQEAAKPKATPTPP